MENIRQNQLVMNEVQKFGSDRIKQQIFVNDMKSIIKNKEIKSKIQKIQQSLERISNAEAATVNTNSDSENTRSLRKLIIPTPPTDDHEQP